MAQDTALLLSGPCVVYVDEGAGDIDVGYTKGGVKLNIDTSTFAIFADQHGSMPVNKIVTGSSVTVDIPLAQYDLVTIRRACTVSVPLQDDVDPTKQRLEIRDRAGLSLRGAARKWTIKAHDPLTGVVSLLPKHWFTMTYAIPDEQTLSIPFAVEEQRVLQVRLYAFPDDANNGRRGFFGDATGVTDANGSGF